jgi:hypothetical protein
MNWIIINAVNNRILMEFLGIKMESRLRYIYDVRTH